MIAWMLYTIVAALIVASTARVAEALARIVGYRLRWIWVGALAFTAFLSASSAAHQLRASSVMVRTSVGPLAASATLSTESIWRRLLRGTVDRFGHAIDAPLQFAATGLVRVLPSSASDYLLPCCIALTVAFAVLVAIVIGRFHRARRAWPHAQVQDVRVRVSPTAGPIVIGVMRPEIVVPRWLFARHPEEQRLVVAHEQEHLRARDPLLLGFAWLVLIVMPWNPACWYMLSRLRLAIELDCDARVLSSGTSPQVYGSLLIDVAQLASPLNLSALGLADESSQLYQRILALRRRVIPFARMRAAGAFVVATAGLLVACGLSTPRAIARSSAVTPLVPTAASAVAAVWSEMGAQRPRRQPNAIALETRKIADSGKQPRADVREVSRALGADSTARSAAAIQADTNHTRRELAAAVETRSRALSATGGEPLVLIDGVRSTLEEMHTTVAARDIEAVEVIKGPAAVAQYGDDAARGVITVKTKKTLSPD